MQECGTDNDTLWTRLHAMPFRSPLWAERYPLLARILEDGRPCQPLNNAFGSRWPNAAAQVGPLTPWEAEKKWFANATGGAGAGGGRYGGGWLSLPLYDQEGFNESQFLVPPADGGRGNWFGKDPGFVQGASAQALMDSLNFTLRPDSPLWGRGWQRIPEESIGVWKRGDVAGADELLRGLKS